LQLPLKKKGGRISVAAREAETPREEGKSVLLGSPEKGAGRCGVGRLGFHVLRPDAGLHRCDDVLLAGDAAFVGVAGDVAQGRGLMRSAHEAHGVAGFVNDLVDAGIGGHRGSSLFA
jgi:hypothetical protein